VRRRATGPRALRELAGGEPVAEPALTPAAERWPNVELDDHGRIVALAGLSLTPTAHRFTVGGRQLYTWCAWDTLVLPGLLDQPAHVESTCPVTRRARAARGRPVRRP
jgi:alkylmercury lyase